MDAIVNLPSPRNVSQLRAALGLIHYYARFLPNISTILNPLYRLLSKSTTWQWTYECENIFKIIKDKLVSGPALAQYDPDLLLV